MTSDPISASINAGEIIRTHVEEAAKRHPELRLSFGYIGNFERWGDDRSFRVFTNRRDSTGRSISMHLGSISNLENAAKRMPESLQTFIDQALTTP